MSAAPLEARRFLYVVRDAVDDELGESTQQHRAERYWPRVPPRVWFSVSGQKDCNPALDGGRYVPHVEQVIHEVQDLCPPVVRRFQNFQGFVRYAMWTTCLVVLPLCADRV